MLYILYCSKDLYRLCYESVVTANINKHKTQLMEVKPQIQLYRTSPGWSGRGHCCYWLLLAWKCLVDALKQLGNCQNNAMLCWGSDRR